MSFGAGKASRRTDDENNRESYALYYHPLVCALFQLPNDIFVLVHPLLRLAFADGASCGAELVKTSCLATYISRIREPQQQQPKADLYYASFARCGRDRTSIYKRAVLRARQMVHMQARNCNNDATVVVVAFWTCKVRGVIHTNPRTMFIFNARLSKRESSRKTHAKQVGAALLYHRINRRDCKHRRIPRAHVYLVRRVQASYSFYRRTHTQLQLTLAKVVKSLSRIQHTRAGQQQQQPQDRRTRCCTMCCEGRSANRVLYCLHTQAYSCARRLELLVYGVHDPPRIVVVRTLIRTAVAARLYAEISYITIA
ncbi:unnamed protein product [Trichogramma brassicae]|uniref:Uncharacterized protein n=1 Tax=Trichogramma brassicae TaxID=86971 RepID=A0A6H5HTX9_9HYME|nr:unnamed protein product [Trichogramma brassicae]